MSDLLMILLLLALVFLAWAFVHLCDWLTEPIVSRYLDGETKR